MLIIFDLDGTLVDSIENFIKSINYVRETLNKKEPIDRDSVIDLLNNYTIKKALNVFGCKYEELEASRVAFKEHYLKHCIDNISFYDGIEEVLDIAFSKNIHLAIATNGSAIFAKKILSHLKKLKYFDIVVGADMVKESKPNPEMLNMAMQATNSTNKDTIMIGDSQKDMQASINAKCEAIFANWGYGNSWLNMPVADNPFELRKMIKWL